MPYRFVLSILLVLLPAFTAAESFLVKNGEPRAVIVLSPDAGRTTRMAAMELQSTLAKISGAKLPVVADPSGEMINLFVGESSHTRSKGITAEGLTHGAYRVVSGENWMALLGDDTEFEPKEPWAKNNSGRKQLQPLWEKASGQPYGVPNGGMYKNRSRIPAGLAGNATDDYFWAFDERGSYNAVCGYLRSLGVRWYLPGEIGEIIPKQETIPLPKIDQTVTPDFEIRQFSVRFGNCDDEVTRWSMRLGIRNVPYLMVAHGMHTMTHPDVLKSQKPDWFAQYGGKRDTETGKRLNHLCYSNEDLFAETVKWAQAQFDVYDFEGVSIMPPDAYGSICQCHLCEGKQIDEMGARGKLSNHVWDFANRVAKEVGKTHPGKKIVCCAYGANTRAPTNITKLEPNVQVVIVGGRRPRNSLPEQQKEVRQLREAWIEKASLPIMIFENYPFTGRGTYLPAFVARTIGNSVNATKGFSRGEDIWLSYPRFHTDTDIGFDHFQVYFTARMYWGGNKADPENLLQEYCDRFYGPAGAKMKSFFDFCEANYQSMDEQLEPVETALATFERAKSAVAPDSIYAKRLALIDTFLNALRSKAEQLGQGRGPVARVRTVWDPQEPIVIDGKLDDEYWVRHRNWSQASLKELQTGHQPVFGTTVMAGWDRSGMNLYFAIRCQDRPGEPLNVTATKHDDEAIWYGDAVEILLDTDSHSYYQIAVNPAGALADLDRDADKSSRLRWESQAEVATHVADDHWVVEIRIPVTDDENDPLNQVVGRKPSQSLPWHFNICRQRVRANGTEHSAISPTGTNGFHVPLKFAHFYDGHSHAFEVDETVTGFLIEYNQAVALKKQRKFTEAIVAFTRLTGYDKITELQKSRVLAEAAYCARYDKDFQRAAEFAAAIPFEPVAKIVRMENLFGQRDSATIIAEFGEEDLSRWPFTEIGAAAFLRGKAWRLQKNGEKAEADLRLALEYTSDKRTRSSLLGAIASNREVVLKDDTGALDVWMQIVNSPTDSGGADLYGAIQSAARILTKQQKYDEALKVLDAVDADKMRGSWAGVLLTARGETLTAAGRKKEAIDVWRKVIENAGSHQAHLEKAEAALAELK